MSEEPKYKHCPHCGKEFEVNKFKASQRYCSPGQNPDCTKLRNKQHARMGTLRAKLARYAAKAERIKI